MLTSACTAAHPIKRAHLFFIHRKKLPFRFLEMSVNKNEEKKINCIKFGILKESFSR